MLPLSPNSGYSGLESKPNIMSHQLPRRKFIKTTAVAAAGAAALPHLGLAGQPTTHFDPKGLPTRRLGKTGVDVPLLAFGTGSRWMSVADDDQALAMLEYALDQGVYFWDTAASYGNRRISSEERVGQLLPSRRKEVFLVTKTTERDADAAKREIEQSLARLKTDYIDLFHVHSINSVGDAEGLGDKGKVLEVLHDYRDQGVLKHIGFTGHTTPEGMRRAAELYDFEAMMIALNHHGRQGTKDFEGVAAPAAKKGLGVIAMKVIRPRESVPELDPGDLVKYSLSLPHFATANIGTDSMEVLKMNLELVRNFEPLSDSKMDELAVKMEPFYRGERLAWMQPGYVDGQVG